jgi:hypothetical protein
MDVRNGIANSDSEDSIDGWLRTGAFQFDQLVEGVRDYAIFLLDANGYIVSWNQGGAAYRGNGQSRERSVFGHAQP